jgi:hypothetical protein
MLVATKRNHHAKPLPVSKRAASIAIALPRTLPSLAIFLWAKSTHKIIALAAPQPSKKRWSVAPKKH